MNPLTRTLYRSLLSVASRFDRNVCLRALLHRQNFEHHPPESEAMDKLVGEYRQFYVPDPECPSKRFVDKVRQGFVASTAATASEDIDSGLAMLRVLNHVLARAEELGMDPDANDHPVDSLRPKDGKSAVVSAPGPGTFVIAHPASHPRSAVLLISHDDAGTMGVTFNSSTQVGTFESYTKTKAQDNRLEYPMRVMGELPVWNGGPAPTVGAFIHRQQSIGANPLGNTGLYSGGSLHDVARLIEDGRCDLQDFLLMAGAWSWGVGQLDAEIEDGSWIVASHQDPWKLLKAANPWQELLWSLGGELAAFAEVPAPLAVSAVDDELSTDDSDDDDNDDDH